MMIMDMTNKQEEQMDKYICSINVNMTMVYGEKLNTKHMLQDHPLAQKENRAPDVCDPAGQMQPFVWHDEA